MTTASEVRAIYEHIQQHFALDYQDLIKQFNAACEAKGIAKTQAQQIEQEMEKTLTLDSDGCYADSNFPARFELLAAVDGTGLDPVADELEYRKAQNAFIGNLAHRQRLWVASQQHNQAPIPKATARQSGARKPARRATQKKASSDDGEGGDGDGEPPRHLPKQLYSYKSLAALLDCSPKAIRNKVSAGLFPAPVKTAFGPRFTQQHLDFVLSYNQRAPAAAAAPKRPRGRPRIAQTLGKGGAV
ncbi:hypothetical protein BAE30_05175 [Acidithiobacillus caldus]|uniref:Uncharacterized protein n=1 Tax=Acidithiobacillus caldus TaxID=33059 RepID=A0A1E7YXY5_9PROT|nr:hypothetical protein BAE30_05175 [Acidithiobacillus caldus]